MRTWKSKIQWNTAPQLPIAPSSWWNGCQPHPSFVSKLPPAVLCYLIERQTAAMTVCGPSLSFSLSLLAAPYTPHTPYTLSPRTPPFIGRFRTVHTYWRGEVISHPRLRYGLAFWQPPRTGDSSTRESLVASSLRQPRMDLIAVFARTETVDQFSDSRKIGVDCFSIGRNRPMAGGWATKRDDLRRVGGVEPNPRH